MSVTSTTSWFQYTIASLGQSFSPPVAIQNTSDLTVTYTNATTLADTVLTLATDYTVTGTSTNGVIAAPVVTLEATGAHYAVGGKLTIQRTAAPTQPTVYVDGQPYLAATSNNSLDWIVYQIQALYDIVRRCMQVSASAPTQPAFTLAARKMGLAGFDVNGNATIYSYPTLPGPASGIVNNANIVGETGGGPNHLDGIDASVYSLGTVIAWNIGGQAAVASGNPAPRVQYMLVASLLPAGPGVVAALNVPTAQWVQIN